MINLVKTEHILTDMIKDAERRLVEATQVVTAAEEHASVGRADEGESAADVKEIEDILASIESKVTGPYDLAASPGVLETGHKALEAAKGTLRSDKEANMRRWDAVLRARAERDLRMLELKLLKIADCEINH